MRHIPDVPPQVFTLSAVAVGYLLLDDSTAIEQNTLGNWLMLVAQVLCTNGYYKALLAQRGQGSDQTVNQSFGDTSNSNLNPDQETQIQMMSKMVAALQQEIEEIKRRMG